MSSAVLPHSFIGASGPAMQRLQLQPQASQESGLRRPLVLALSPNHTETFRQLVILLFFEFTIGHITWYMMWEPKKHTAQMTKKISHIVT